MLDPIFIMLVGPRVLFETLCSYRSTKVHGTKQCPLRIVSCPCL